MSFSERPAPIVALNGQDSRNGRVFTLLHEVVHVLLLAGGLCDLDDLPSRMDPARGGIERFCNRVAAATLIPRQALAADEALARGRRQSVWPDALLAPLANRFGVSPEAMLLRLVTLGYATAEHYQERRLDFLRTYAARREVLRQAGSSGPVPVANKRLAALRRRYVSETLDAYDRHDINRSDLSDYLDMKLNHLPALIALVRRDA